MAETQTEPLTGQQKWIVVGLTVLIAATRLMALAHSLWDWDEALFVLSLHDYNVAAHHPHPPGFPLYVILGRLVRLLVHDDFRALRSIQLVAGMAVFPTLYALARAMRYPFAVAISAGVLFAFLPNVWALGGTAYSDTLNIVLLLAALALLLTGRSERGRYFAGTALFSMSLLIRPQNVLFAYSWFAASWSRVRERRMEIAGAALLSIAIVFGGYGIAAKVTGWRDYVAAVHSHGQYVSAVDGYRNPSRPPSLRLFPDFVIDPFDAGKTPRILFGFAVLALLPPRKRDGEALATFLPFLVFALFMLNPSGASRLSIGFMPLIALLASEGIARVAGGVGALLRRPYVPGVIQTACVVALAGRFAFWLAPALREVRRNDSPPVQAMKWVCANLPPGTTVFVQGGFSPHAEYYLAGYQTRVVGGEDDLLKLPPARNTWYVSDAASTDAAGVNFLRPRDKLFALFSRRYFEASVRPLTGRVRFVDGWYDAESSGGQSWRWMRERGRLSLEPMLEGAELRFSAFFPIDHEPPPLVTITVDQRDIDRFVASRTVMSRRYDIPPSPAPHDVTIAISTVVNPARQHLGRDDRDLGMQLRTISWQP